MAVDHRRVIIDEIEIGFAVNIFDSATLTRGRVDRMRRVPYGGASVAARHYLAGTVE